ncbi:MAG: amidohydrolase [Desulfovibrio sp.]|nr:amidohydrolase [Desulfovibrio sp.]
MARAADTVFMNGQVITVNDVDAVVSALAVRDGRIVFVGDEAGAADFAAGAGEIVDLGGRSLIPGFTDAHEHLLMRGQNELGLDCRFPGVRSVEDIKAKVAERARITPKGGWIRGWGYDHSKLAEGRHPDRFDLDAAAPEHKVLIQRVCCHIAACNSRALEYAGRPDGAGEAAGGFAGQGNGVMFEEACAKLVNLARPSPGEMEESLALVNDLLLREGITCCHDAGGYGALSMRALQEAVERDKLKARIVAMVFSLIGGNSGFIDACVDSGLRSGFGNGRLKLGPIKIMIDGSSSGPTAATLEGYAVDPDNHGLLNLTREYIEETTQKVHVAGWQMTAHAVGDKAVTMFADALEKAMKAQPRADCRHRIEHCAMAGPEMIRRIRRLGVVPVAQPVFLYEFGDGYLRNYGEKRGGNMFPCASMLKAGIPVAGSSDCPVTFSNPLLGMHVAVNRETQSGRLVGPEERVTTAQALRMFTWNAAYASFDERLRGSLETGKLADLAVLSEPLLDVPAQKIRDVRVDMTFVGGEKVFER